jgi:hypothetical protein
VGPVALRSGEITYQVLRGKLSKKAHTSGIRTAVTKAWSDRFFIFDYSNGDLYYWKDQPNSEYVKNNQDQEHFKGTRVVLSRAKLSEASAGAALCLLHRVHFWFVDCLIPGACITPSHGSMGLDMLCSRAPVQPPSCRILATCMRPQSLEL